jgi:Bacteriophytochrome (light-regulated signal transduction histidine kinase)
MAKIIKQNNKKFLPFRRKLIAQQVQIKVLKEELIIAKEMLHLQDKEKQKRATELGIANEELIFEDSEKEKRAAELGIANIELGYQKDEKEKRAQELTIANKELAFQNKEKEKRAVELTIANIELAYQNEEKEKRAEELILANKKLLFENEEKERRAAELVIANQQLAFQNEEKEKRAAELSIANKELAYQNKEKEKRAAELSMANIELAYQNDEKEKRAAELIVANKQLLFDNEEKEKRAAEMIIINKELTNLTFISSHDLQEPLRKIQIFVSRLLSEEVTNLSENGTHTLLRMNVAVKRMEQLINDLLTLSLLSTTKLKFEEADLNIIIEEAKTELAIEIQEKQAIIETIGLDRVTVIRFQFEQLMVNLISNSLKFSKPDIPPHIIISSTKINSNEFNNSKLLPNKNYCIITIKDNGIGFDPLFSERIFEVFKKFHSHEINSGTGMGLAVVKKIVENHNGFISAKSEPNIGTSIDVYIPNISK